MKVARTHLLTVGSTNEWARLNLRQLPRDALSVVTADEQTAGRGRLGRTWVSGRDDIKVTFAFFLPRETISTAYLLSPLLSVAALRALAEASVPECSIKWPNDIIARGCRKVGGILCEMEGPLEDGSFFCALGIGLNCNSMPEELGVDRPVWPLSTLRAELGKLVPVPALLESLVSHFALALPIFQLSGWSAFRDEYERASILLGRVIRFAAGGSEGLVEGKVLGFAEDGSILMQLAHERKAFLSGEVSRIELVDGGAVEGRLE
jgi:BirA family transcriptional regulator, biotin operon repressor / biotin---[acetyl-CoA-carboxylase] ligase